MQQRNNYPRFIFIVITSVLLLGVSLIGLARPQASEQRQPVDFFTVPVHLVLPNHGYVETVQVETNHQVSLRGLLAFHLLAQFNEDQIIQVNHVDEKKHVQEQFLSQTGQPFYVRVLTQNAAQAQRFASLLTPNASLSDDVLAEAGIEIVIEQPFVDQDLGTTTFLTPEAFMTTLATQQLQLPETASGTYDHTGTWLPHPVVESEAAPIVDEVWEQTEWTPTCAEGEVLEAGSCVSIPPVEEVIPPTPETPEAPTPTPPPVPEPTTPEPTPPAPTPEPTDPQPPVTEPTDPEPGEPTPEEQPENVTDVTT